MKQQDTFTAADALHHISGSLINGHVVYRDDATGLYYIGLEGDLAELVDLMDSDDEDTARDAYSHWCARTAHGDGYTTEEAAITAASR